MVLIAEGQNIYAVIVNRPFAGATWPLRTGAFILDVTWLESEFLLLVPWVKIPSHFIQNVSVISANSNDLSSTCVNSVTSSDGKRTRVHRKRP